MRRPKLGDIAFAEAGRGSDPSDGGRCRSNDNMPYHTDAVSFDPHASPDNECHCGAAYHNEQAAEMCCLEVPTDASV